MRMNLAELASALSKELERVHTANPFLELESDHAELDAQVGPLMVKVGAYFERVRLIAAHRAPKCPDCGHRWGLHPMAGEFQEHLGCAGRVPRSLDHDDELCGCQQAPPQ